MLRSGVCFLLFTFVVLVAAWSDEPVRQQQPIKQRVSPRVLKEAMALPEYQGKAAESPQQLLEDLQRLSDRLRKVGDIEGADLVQRFIREHQQMVRHVAQYSVASEGVFDVNCKVIEVNTELLSEDSILRNYSLDNHNQIENSGEIRHELDQLVKSKKAKTETFLLSTRGNQPVRCSVGGEFPVPAPGADEKVTIGFREYGTTIEILPTVLTNDRTQLQIKCTCAEKDLEHAVDHFGTKIPGLKTTSFSHTFEITYGQAGIYSHPATKPGHRLFLITTVNPHL